jgi:hypothetical protein
MRSFAPTNFCSITSQTGAKAMLRPLVENSLQPNLNSAPLQELVVTLDEQNEEFHEELNEHQEESLSGGGDLKPSVLIRPGGNAYVIERR